MNLWNRIKLWAWVLVDYSGPVLEAEDCLDEPRLSAYERQRRSFVYGNTKLANPDVTRELVDSVADEMAELWCKGHTPCQDPMSETHTCLGSWGWVCERCARVVLAEPDCPSLGMDLWVCANGCNWHPCSEVG